MGTFPAAQMLDEAAAACERDDYDTACRMSRRLAGQGDAEAWFKLGGTYFSGEGIPLDYAQAADMVYPRCRARPSIGPFRARAALRTCPIIAEFGKSVIVSIKPEAGSEKVRHFPEKAGMTG